MGICSVGCQTDDACGGDPCCRIARQVRSNVGGGMCTQWASDDQCENIVARRCTRGRCADPCLLILGSGFGAGAASSFPEAGDAASPPAGPSAGRLRLSLDTMGTDSHTLTVTGIRTRAPPPADRPLQ